MNFAVASGKGGTGKTTLAVNLARVYGSAVRLLDCDVEEPNAHLFLDSTLLRRDVVSIPVPQIDSSRCDGCGACSRFCEYNAIISLPTGSLVFPELCHGCGGCMRVCPRQAIREVDHRIGIIETRDAGDITLVQGLLDVGASLAPPIIRAMTAGLNGDTPAILDAPPGTSCPVVTTLRETDFVLLVTEPTPFGLHDLTLAVEMVRSLRVPFGVAVNRMGIGDHRVHDYCRREDIALLLEIPDDRRIAEAYSRGQILVEALPEYRRLFETLLDKIAERQKAEVA